MSESKRWTSQGIWHAFDKSGLGVHICACPDESHHQDWWVVTVWVTPGEDIMIEGIARRDALLREHAAAPDLLAALQAEADYEALSIALAGGSWPSAAGICDKYPVLHQDMSGPEALRIMRGYSADLRRRAITKARGMQS